MAGERGKGQALCAGGQSEGQKSHTPLVFGSLRSRSDKVDPYLKQY